jgi:hypothetical protein
MPTGTCAVLGAVVNGFGSQSAATVNSASPIKNATPVRMPSVRILESITADIISTATRPAESRAIEVVACGHNLVFRSVPKPKPTSFNTSIEAHEHTHNHAIISLSGNTTKTTGAPAPFGLLGVVALVAVPRSVIGDDNEPPQFAFPSRNGEYTLRFSAFQDPVLQRRARLHRRLSGQDAGRAGYFDAGRARRHPGRASPVGAGRARRRPGRASPIGAGRSHRGADQKARCRSR